MNFSLLSVFREHGPGLWQGLVDGYWIQDHSAGTLETAIEKARATNAVNSNAMTIAIVPYIGPHACYACQCYYKQPLAVVRGQSVTLV